MTSRPLVSICFDDGRETAVLEGRKILEDHGMLGTYYIIPTTLNTRNPDGIFATADQVCNLAHAGHEIGNHSYTHSKDLIDDVHKRRTHFFSSHLC